MTLGSWFKSDFGSFVLQLFHVYRSSQNLVDCLSISLLGHYEQAKGQVLFRSDYFDHRFDSTDHYSNYPPWLWKLSGPFDAWDLNISIVSKDSQSVVAVSTVIFDLQRKTTTEFFKNFESLLTNYFSFVEKDVSSRPKCMSCSCMINWLYHSNLSKLLDLFLYSVPRQVWHYNSV